MNNQQSLQELAKIGQELDRTLSGYSAFVDKTVRKYVDASKGGTLNYVAAIISREQRALQLVIENKFDFKSTVDKPLDGFQWDALIERKALYVDLLDFFDEESHHQLELQKALSDTDGLTKSERLRLQKDVPKLEVLIRQFDKTLDETDRDRYVDDEFEKPDPKDQRSDDTDYRDPNSSRSQTGGKPMSDPKNCDTSCTADALQGVVDAISRLQPDAATGLAGSDGSTANAYNLFSAELDQRLQSTLGMPNLDSDGARAMDQDDLLDKLFDGLDRSVLVSDTNGGSLFQFNPLKARGSALGSEMNALGAQAVTADHIRALKSPILANLNGLTNEDYCCDHEIEADALRRAIETNLDTLSYEASAEAGAFDEWVETIFDQMLRDLLDLLDHYGIKSSPGDVSFENLAQQLCGSMDQVLKTLNIKSAKTRTRTNKEISIFTAEKNNKTLSAILFDFGTMYRMLLNDGSLGPLLGRIRALNDAICASVISARNALATAGISIEDQSVSYSDDTGAQINSISLRRLLGWIESESITARSVLLKSTLHTRDLRRLKTARNTQQHALGQIVADNFATININNYAVGRRHLRELNGHLIAVTDLLDTIVPAKEPHAMA